MEAQVRGSEIRRRDAQTVRSIGPGENELNGYETHGCADGGKGKKKNKF